MAEDDNDDDLPTSSEDGSDDPLDKPASKLRGKRLVIIIVVVILVIIGIGAGLYFSGIFKGAPKEDTHAAAEKGKDGEAKPAAPSEVFLDLEEFLVNLDAAGKQPSFLKMTVTLVLPDEAAVLEVKTKLPRIRDGFQVYLRELRIDDLQGSAGLYRLREELLLRLNKLMYPVVINDILFKSILVQ